MKKILSGFVLLFIAAILITPLVVGIIAEKKIGMQIAKLSQITDVTISNTYKRNWFLSKSETTFNLSQFLASYGLARFDSIPVLANIMVKSRSEIVHGPFPVKRYYSKQPLVKPMLSVVKSVTSIIFPPDVINFTPTITTYTSVYPDGSGNGVFSLPGINYNDNVTGQLINSGKIDGEMGFSADMSMLFVDLSTPEILLKNRDKSININDFNCSWRDVRGADKINSGNFELSINSITSDKTTIGKAAFSSSQEEKNGNLSFNVDISIESLKDDNADFGPAEINLSGRNIKKSVYKQLAALLNSQNASRENQFEQVLLMTQMTAMLPELLSESPEINLSKFDIGTPEGKISVKASIKADNTKLTDPNDLKEIIQSINIDFSMVIPNNIAEKYVFNSDNPRSILLQQMMVQEGDNFKINIKYNDAQLFVNGKPFSLLKNTDK